MENIRTADEMLSDLQMAFKKDNVVLFVGQNGKSELTPKLCALPWSCVITSCTNAEFGSEFAEKRKPHKYSKVEELPITIFSRSELPIIQLYGNVEETNENLNEYDDEFMKQTLIQEDAKKILDHIMIRMDIRSKLVIIGYDPTVAAEFPVYQFILSWRRMKGASIDLYGTIDNDNFKLIENEIKKRGGNYTEKKLIEVIETREEIDSEYKELEYNTKNVFYKGRSPYTISRSILLSNSNIAELLTDELIYDIRPLGKIEQAKWFYNFLNNSPEAPQWYGYLPQSCFYLKRDYEERLVDLTKKLLAGDGMKKESNIPIILQGDPGSSKSIEMGALAYRIYQEKLNPVIYIKNDNLSFSDQSPELEQLDELMQEVESIGIKDTRFLVIWDSSSYKKVVKNAHNLIRCLENRGRRLVLVCTAYSKSGGIEYEYSLDGERYQGNNKGEWYYYNPYSLDKQYFVKSNTSNGDIYYDNNCYFVTASRKMNEKEIIQLKQKAKDYSVASSDILKSIWNNLSDNNDVFDYFFQLMETLRPRLETNLTREQQLVNRYVNKQLEDISFKEEEYSVNPILDALLKAGITVDDDERKIIEQEDILEEYNLEKFNTCIAVFSRFKLNTPYSLALRMLCDDDDKLFKKNSNYNNYELFRVLTCQIPYIHYCEVEEGHFVFRYRNVLEAQLFLKRNAVESIQQIEIICLALDYYAETYRRQGDIDLELKTELEKILRIMGPNTDYVDFQTGGKKEAEHKEFMNLIEKLINKLSDLRTQYHVPDMDGGLSNIEITFIREYYGKLWDVLHLGKGVFTENVKKWEVCPEKYTKENYEQRIKKLKSASDLALENIEKIKNILESDSISENKYYLVNQINSLSVEACLCSRALEEKWNEYNELCCGKPDMNYSDVRPLTYSHQYDMLVKATISDPLNGYAYNALFEAFEREYDKSDPKRRLQLLSEVSMIADEAMTLPIVSRGMNGNDELTKHFARIKKYSCERSITISEVEKGERENPFMELFQEMLDRNSASAICFVCQQELQAAKLGGIDIAKKQKSEEDEYVLNDKQLDVCRRIIQFMKKEEYELSICNSPYALYILLRVEWMYYNKRPLSAGKEKQRTYLTSSEWIEINRVCELYESCSGASPRPIVSLIYALSELQIKRDYRRAISLISRMSETSFYSTPRMRVPYLVCFTKGVPELYTGTVLSIRGYKGFIKYDGVPERLGNNTGIRFYMKNLNLRRMPSEKQIIVDLELGLGYTGFSAYKETNKGGER